MKTKIEISAGGIVYRKIYHLSSIIYHLQWLICQHSQHKGWVFPKGLIGDSEKNESMETAAIREVEEEGGIKAKIINHKPVKVLYRYVFTASAPPSPKWLRRPSKASAVKVKKTVYYFLMEYVSGDPKNHDWEMNEAKFVTEEEIKKTLTYSSDKEAFEKIQKLGAR
jgi:8-oxo-dGTP pyrophosphatase MutT (NUDIX family)